MNRPPVGIVRGQKGNIMRYIINYGLASEQDQPCRLTTFAGIDASTPDEARRMFLAAHPDRYVVRVIDGTQANRELYSAGAWTDEEREAHKEKLSAKYAQEHDAAQSVKEYVATYELDEFAARIAYEDRRASEGTQNAEGVHVGDLFSCEWGYDQTNVNYYQVVALKGAHTIVVRELRTRRMDIPDTMTGYSRPIRDSFRDESPYTLRTRIRSNELDINAPEHCGTLRPWKEGELGYYTSYA